MAALTLTQQFGTNASISNGVLSITLADLAAVGLNGSSPSPADIAAALVLLWKANQGSSASDDPTVGVVVAESFVSKQFVSRGTTNPVAQIEYQYAVSIFTPDSTSALDPDSVV